MKNTFKLSLSVFRSNMGFSIGLLLLYFFCSTLIAMTCILPISVQTSINNFLHDYNVSQATIITNPMQKDVEGLDTSIKGVSNIDSQMTIDVSIDVNNNIQKQMRIFSTNKDSFHKFDYYEQSDDLYEENSAWMSSYIASVLGCHVGDHIKINFQGISKDVKISAIVFSPESTSCIYDDTYWQEDKDFGYLYITEQNLENLFGIKDIYNLRTFLFDNDCSLETKEEALSKAENILGDKVASSELFEKSKAKNVIDQNLQALEDACGAFPLIIFIVAIVCAFLFIFQIIRNNRKKIGLLRALGYTSSYILIIYILYTIAVSVTSIFIGSFCGMYFSNFIINVFKVNFSIPNVSFVLSSKFYLFILLLLATSIFACFVGSREIFNIDPSEAYSDSVITQKPYKFKTKFFLKLNPFYKIILAKILKHKLRFVIFSICISSCIILCFAGIAAMHSKAKSNVALFDYRLNYDLLVNIDNETIINKISSLDEVESLEKSIVFTDNSQDNKILLTFTALDKDSKLVIPYDINFNVVRPANGVVIDSYIAKLFNLGIGDSIKIKDRNIIIDKIACGFEYFSQYISFDTAKNLGYSNINTLYIKLKPNTDSQDVFNKIKDMDGFKYMKFLDHQKETRIKSQASLDYTFLAVIFIAITIGIIIIFNMVSISINERKKEYATLLALGTTFSKFRRMVILENALQYITAVVFSSLPAYFMGNLILSTMSSTQKVYPFVDVLNVYVESFLVALICILAGIIITLNKIRNINLATDLNIHE